MRVPAPDRIFRAAVSPLGLAVLVAAVALIPGRAAALAAGFLALAALVRAVRLRSPAAVALLATVALASAAYVLVPAPAGPAALSRATIELETAWRAALDGLARAAAPAPLAGSDFGWLSERAAGLGPGAGAALLAPDAARPVAWSGWTTPLSERERAQLTARLADGTAVVVLRRGLTVRLLVARRDTGREALVVAAERPLPPEPELGPLGAAFGGSVRALVRWEALGEGLRAPIESEDNSAGDTEFWSLVPLMAGRNVAGRVSLGVDAPEAVRAHRDVVRRRWVGAVAAIVLLGFGLARRGSVGLAAIAAARIAALAAWPASLPAAPAAATAWALVAARLFSPLDAAATGLAAVLLALSFRPRRRAVWTIGGGLVLAAGTVAIGVLVVQDGLAPGELLVAGDALLTRAALVIALVSFPLAGAVLMARATPRLPWATLVAAGVAGTFAGLVQNVATPAAARRVGEERVLAELRARHDRWTAALERTLRLAWAARGELVPDRDAIDLWWNSPLARLGLASGVWKLGPDGALEDAFLFGLPPVQPGAGEDLPDRPGGDDGARLRGPARVERGFLGGTSALLMADIARPDGGRWVAAILDEPGNLAGERAPLPIAGTPGAVAGSPYLVPHLTWFDARGHRAGADLPGELAAPRGIPAGPRWRRTTVADRAAMAVDIPDPGGTVSVVFFRPGLLQRAALVVDRVAVSLLVVLVLGALGALSSDPRSALRAVSGWILRIGSHFREQAIVFLVVAGLVPLLVLGIAGRVAAERQARRQLLDEATRAAHFARNLVEDYLRLAGVGPTGLTDSAAAWLARTVGDDLFVWDGGTLAATSRPDLVRAGAWPPRFDGEAWDALANGHVPLLVQSLPGTPRGSATVANGPFRMPDGRTGVLSIPLRRAERRIEEALADVDRALLVSVVLLVVSTGLLVARATRRLVGPLAELERATTRIAAGDFSGPAPAGGYAETRALVDATQSMAQSLAEQRQALERRRATIETLIARMPIAVLSVSPDGIVEAANPRAADLTGAEPGQPLRVDDDALRNAVRRLSAASGDVTESVDAATADSRRHLAVTAIDLPGLVDARPARLVVVEDLTDTVRSERLTAWAEMARRIAHEIKNPLTPISLVVDHVRHLRSENDPRFAERLDSALATVAEQVRVLRETAREFSDYARLLEARPEPLDLARLVREWVAPYTLAPPPGVSVESAGPDVLPALEGDPRLLRRAVVNLVDNALAAVAGGGRIGVRWLHDAAAGTVRIEIADDGPGIAPEQLPALFQTGATTRETGSGLGLPIALQAAVAHGGRIDVDTRPGNGARFSIVLPLSRDGSPGP